MHRGLRVIGLFIYEPLYFDQELVCSDWRGMYKYATT